MNYFMTKTCFRDPRPILKLASDPPTPKNLPPIKMILFFQHESGSVGVIRKADNE